MKTFKSWLKHMLALVIFGWAVGCIFVAIVFASTIGDNWHPGFDDHPWGVAIGCLAYFALIIPIVWILRRSPVTPPVRP